MDNDEVTWMLGVAREAGNLALSFFGHTTGTLKPDSSWVTEADLAVEEFVREAIQSAHPDETIIGEETPIDPVDPSRRVWAIDPIDGTRAFNHGFPVWGVSIGLLEDGKPEAGAIVLPALNDLYHSYARHKVFGRDSSIEILKEPGLDWYYRGVVWVLVTCLFLLGAAWLGGRIMATTSYT